MSSDPDLRLDEVGDAIAEARAFASSGGRTIVDAMPSACGRDADGLAQVARAAGVHVIATAGFHTEAYYDELHWRRRYPVDLLAQVIEDECRLGFDRWDCAGPLVERLAIRPGLLKCAFGYNAVTAAQHRGALAVARVHAATVLPVLVPLEQGTGGSRALEVLLGEGVAPDAIGLSHVDRNPDLGYHAELAASGAFLVYDGPGRERYRPESAVIQLVAELVGRGHADRLLLRGDLARRSARLSAGGLGIVGAFNGVAARLGDAVGGAVTHQFLVTNPARFLTLRAAL